MVQFRAEITFSAVALMCLALFYNMLVEIDAQENENGTSSNDTNPNIPSSNSNPLADAGADATYTEGEEVFVDGSASSDPEGDELSYFWKQLTPSSPTLDIKSESINFYSKTPEVIDNTVFELELTVEDGKGGKDSDLVQITVNGNSEEPKPSLLSPPNTDAASVNRKNDTLLPSTSTLLPSSLAGDKNDTLSPSTPGAAPSSSESSDTLLPTLDELTELQGSDPDSNSDVEGLEVVAVGDFGCEKNAVNTVDTIKSLSPDITIALGDFSYEHSADCWLSIVTPIENNLELVKGNHDIEPPEIWNQYISALDSEKSKSSKISGSVTTKDGHYYSFDNNGIHFLIMDSEVPFKTGSSQYNYVKNDLDKAHSNPEIKWIIVSLHRTFYFGEPETPSPEILRKNVEVATALKQDYHPLFDKYGVDLVLAGHEHNYQRSYPLKFNTASSEPTVSSLEKENYVNIENPIFLTIGTGGVIAGYIPVTQREAADQETLPSYIVTTNGPDNTKGVLDLKFSNGNSVLEGTFHTNDGNILDRFSISKKGSSTAMLVPPS